jgi:Domain of Unknown Function (DUF1080)
MKICMPIKKFFLMLAVIVTASYAAAPTAFAQDDSNKPDAADAQDKGFDVQGEYTGDLEVEGQKFRVGMQVIALGNNDYQVAVYHGGLPGDGWDSATGYEVVGKPDTDGTKITFRKEDRRVEFSSGAGQVFVEDNHIGQLDRVVRESDTLNDAPPEGAGVLFDGSTGDSFEAQDGGDPVVDGLLRQGITSKQKFNGDFSLHIEFKLPFEPTKSGQARSNSGIYLQGRYEVQMLDSFGLKGEDNECGGIYGIKKPDVNMCYPPESWQTYDIDFQSARWDGDKKTANARMSVRHNGVVIHDDVELPNTTTAAPVAESPEPGFIYLQNHGSEVRYRNIWVIQK